jgi:large subunit ribosomal protein L24e
MANCSFCKSELAKGTGKMLIKNSGKILWFCSRKCEKNMLQLKRNPVKFKWSAKIKQVLKK